jgi:hypothetical protein
MAFYATTDAQLDGVIMARWRAGTWQYLTNFDGCGFGKYCNTLLSPTSLVPFKTSHNLLVRGPNPWGGTNVISDFRLLIADC